MGTLRIMEVIMKMRVLTILLVMSFSGFINAQSTKASKKKAAVVGLSDSMNYSKSHAIKLTKVLQHEESMVDKLDFYFSNRPICTYIPSVDAAGASGEQVPVNTNGQVELEFFLPLTKAGTKAQKLLNQLTATLDKKDDTGEDSYQYRLKFEPDYAKGGLTCRVVFRPEEIGFHQESFEGITGEPVLRFSFLKRKVIQDLNNKLRPIIQTAQVKKKLMWQWTADTESVIRAS